MEIHADMEGVAQITESKVIDMTTGKMTSEGFGIFTGKVKIREGGFVYTCKGSGQYTSPTGDTGMTMAARLFDCTGQCPLKMS